MRRIERIVGWVTDVQLVVIVVVFAVALLFAIIKNCSGGDDAKGSVKQKHSGSVAPSHVPSARVPSRRTNALAYDNRMPAEQHGYAPRIEHGRADPLVGLAPFTAPYSTDLWLGAELE